MSISTRIRGGEIASVTDNGPRSSNEDREWTYCLSEEYDLPIRAILAVADGAGGGDAGEVASQIAIQRLQQRVHHFVYAEVAAQIQTMSREHLGEALCDLLNDLFENLQDEIRRTGGQRSATTLTVTVLCDGFFVFGHVGDSRLYRATREGLVQLSTDQKSSRRGPVRALGSARVDPQVEVVPLESDTLLILCSDGVSDVLDGAEMRSVLGSSSSVNTAAPRLVARARERGTRDNCTVALGLQGDYRVACPPIAAREGLASLPIDPVVPVGPSQVRPKGRARGGRRVAILVILILMSLCAAAIGWTLYRSDHRAERSDALPSGGVVEAPDPPAGPSGVPEAGDAVPVVDGSPPPEDGSAGPETPASEGALKVWWESRREELRERERRAVERAERERLAKEREAWEAEQARQAELERRRAEQEARRRQLARERRELARNARIDAQKEKLSEALAEENLEAALFLLAKLREDFPGEDLAAYQDRVELMRSSLEEVERDRMRLARQERLPFSVMSRNIPRPATGCFDFDSKVVFDPRREGAYFVLAAIGEGWEQWVVWGAKVQVDRHHLGETQEVKALWGRWMTSSKSRLGSATGGERNLSRAEWRELLEGRIVTFYVLSAEEYEGLGAPLETELLSSAPEARSVLELLPTQRFGFQGNGADPCPVGGREVRQKARQKAPSTARIEGLP